MDRLPGQEPDHDAGLRWKHDVRNAANAIQLAVDVASRMMATGNLAGAETNLHRAMEACGILTNLLNPPTVSRRE